MFDFQDWNHKRIKLIIENYSHKFFYYKSVLDLGAGDGEVGAAFLRLGAESFAAEADEKKFRALIKNHPRIKSKHINIETNWIYNKKMDLILHLDLLHLLNDPEQNLRKCCENSVHIVLECPVFDSNDDHYAKSHNLTLLSESKIETIFTECGFSFKKIVNNRLNSGNYIYDWQPNGSKEISVNKRRFWFASKVGLAKIPASLDHFKKQQTYPQITPVQHVNVAPVTGLKVALCISGYLRTFDRTFQNLKQHVIDRLNPDIFIHTWDTVDCYGHSTPISQVFDRVNSLYRPKNIIIETASQFKSPPEYNSRTDVPHRSSHWVMSMFYKIAKCNELKYNYEKINGKYDIVIRSRPDILFNSPLNITSNVNEGIVYLPRYGNFGGLNDQLAYGSSATMDKYSSLYYEFDKYVREGIKINPEIYLNHHIRKQNIQILRDDVSYVLLRINGSRQDNFLLENPCARR